ncbi:MAG: type I DNA topoisomerase [Anaerovoracaceae bacterium]|jgi:DNA topoisomerase-1
MAETAPKKRTSKKKPARKRNLVIVESPSKAKTIGRFLGSNYKVVASVGHVRDLPKSKLGIDIEDDFEPKYINIRGQGDTIKMLKKEAKNANKIFIATDPDREGEAIAWHLQYLLGIDEDTPCRVEFNEITKDTVKEAIKHPRKLDMRRVDAQQARRVLDRLVGYQISPLLWRKVSRGLSAGRVQSATLKIICDREREIRDFVPEEYWTVEADMKKGDGFTARLTHIEGKKAVLRTKDEADRVLADVDAGSYTVGRVTKSDRRKNPQPPFTTSSMQQDAANKLNFNTGRTMAVAQALYEGIDLRSTGVTAGGPSTVGLITYMRTDSVRLSDEARAAAKDYITENFGEQYYHSNYYSNKNKEVQDAHEAIRPARPDITPSMIKDALTAEQYKLYSLIWSRFMASQMAPAVYDSVKADINNGKYLFRASGSRMKFDGFTKVYSTVKKEENTLLPELEEGETLPADPARGTQNFTQPPARYTEASLVRTLEEKGIGRPSTYAPTVMLIIKRRYVKREKKQLVPTDLGFTVNDLMEEYFSDIVDTGFTSDMEEKLDDVEVKGTDWKQVIRDFYGPFSRELENADANIEKVVIEDEPTGEMCELCGRPMVIKHGRYGKFIACSGYPECRNKKPLIVKTGVTCPNCGGDIIERRGRSGRIFYGCSNYPDCRQVFWDRPINRKCPKCGSLLVEKNTKTIKYACSNKDCGYKEKQNQ